MDCRFGIAPENDSATVGTGALTSTALVYALTALLPAVFDAATVGSGLIWVEANRAPSRTAEVRLLAVYNARSKSTMPKTMSNRMGSTMANSTSAAARSESAKLRTLIVRPLTSEIGAETTL